MLKKIIMLFLTIASIGLLTGFWLNEDDYIRGTDGLGKKAVVNQSDIVYFSYVYSNAFGDGSYSYKIDTEENPKVFFFQENIYSNQKPITYDMDDSVLTALKDIYLDCDIATWNGFNKTNINVLDGDGFSLNIIFADGEHLTASGSNCAPEGYRNFKAQLDNVFAPLIKLEVEK